MAIRPEDINTISLSQLPSENFDLSDILAHEVGGNLKQGTVQNLADVIGAYLDVSGGVGFRAVTVNDGETLPTTTQEEFILVGKGTFYNVGGGATITTTEELNALISNGTYWSIGVAIDISVSIADYITQLIRTGFTGTSPSEDAVFNALATKLNISDFNDAINNLPIEIRLPVNDANITLSGAGGKLVAYTAITADRTVTLPSATIANQRIWVTDESGLCSNVRRIIVMPSGSDIIGGDSFAVINFPNGSGYFESNGIGRWNIISTTSIQLSAGVQSMPTVTDNGNGSVTLGVGVYSLFANTNGAGRPKSYQVSGGTFTFTNNSTNFIYADYNTTTGVVTLQQTTSESPLNDLTQVLIYAAYRQGTTLHARNFDTWGLALVNKLNRSIYRTQRVRFEEGGVLIGESASPAVRTITISAGTVWVAAAENPLALLTSAANTCYHVIQTSPGVWNTTTVVTQYNNTQYNTTAGLVTLSNNNYAVNWVFRSVGTDNDMAIVLGGGDYNLGQAQSSSKPTNLPTFLRHMELVGRIIVQKSANTATQIDNVSSTFFTASGVTDHESLNNLQGGAANDHWHLTNAQYLVATKPAGSIIKTRKDVSTTTYTLLSSDVDKILYFTNASGCTVTIPAGLTTLQEYEFLQYAAGQVSFVTSGTTLVFQDYEIATTAQLKSRVLASWIDTETYQLMGQLAMI